MKKGKATGEPGGVFCLSRNSNKLRHGENKESQCPSKKVSRRLEVAIQGLTTHP